MEFILKILGILLALQIIRELLWPARDEEESMNLWAIVELNPISAFINITNRAIDAENNSKAEVRSVTVGWKPNDSYLPGDPTPDGTPTYYRVIREGKGR